MPRIQPSNAQIKAAFDEHAKTDEHFQDEQRLFNEDQAVFRAETEGSLAEIHARLKEVPTKNEIAEIVEGALGKILLSKGKIAYTSILTLAGIFVAMGAIFGGFKGMLAALGFHLTK